MEMKNTKRKKTIRILCCVAILIGIIHIIHGLTLDKKIEYKEEKFYSTNITEEMDGYKIGFITDTHAITAEKLEKAVEKLNEYNLDILLLGGDFPSKENAPMRSMKIISKVKTIDGIYGVEGNHDNYITLFEAMKQYNIKPLSNSGVKIKENFYLAGVEDLWRRNPDIKKAIKGAKPEDFTLLLSHNPDLTMLQNTKEIDLILSGHTHGGHITFFGLWAPELTIRKTITKYGQKFMSGWSKSRDETPVYVSNGVGDFIGVPRIFARPQIIIMTLNTVEQK